MKKVIFVAFFAVVMMFVLIGCGNGNGATLTIPYIGLTDGQIEVATDLGEMDMPYNRYMYGLRRAIEAELDDFNIEFVDWGWAETLDAQQRAGIAAGTAPDIVVGEIFMPTYANEGILRPLPQDIVDTVNPSFLIRDPNGVPVAVALRASVFMLFYNRDLLEAAGFDSAPRYWDEWQTMSDAITELGNGEFWGGGVPSFPHAGGALRATPFFRQNGTDFFMNGQVMLDDPRLQEALEFIRSMDRNLPPGMGNAADEGPMWNAFEEQQVIAFVVNGTWQATGAERNNMNWGVAPLPIPRGGQEGNCLVAAMYVAVPEAAANPEASFDIIRIALRDELSSIWLDDTVPSPRQDIVSNPARWSHNPPLAQAMEAVAGGQVTGLASFPQNDAQIWEIINTRVLARTTITNDPIENITAEALADINNLLS
ncbi:MAG: extracellular solute-binding protein [Oscillospiraceae bacterium]|nr:extracellular solute-binding protein [Oscillospiraceae bacterium]MCL2278361.1 extracellular solute-binding protein [Oscillospiraceae bacterium]